MKPLVLASIEDASGDRCVDIIRLSDGQFAYRECRRDPEDGHGWRYLSAAPPAIFDSEDAARKAAMRDIGWMME
ncbi:hypothetical protein [Roseobacter sp. CCS2]|uniref:hypothetical protein n=1 Tax=Roseobacter sp. CCS2 TaxID=391593 RepID=UPI0000F40169|nr:hypothetical protein [Roseobacter sp. CCS2]EBA12923.1 hypothetical protein RCCS2_03539 [Roseobacter sp. CCS2]